MLKAVHGISLEQLAAEPLLSRQIMPAKLALIWGMLHVNDRVWVAHNGKACLIYHLFDTSFQGYGVRLPEVPVIDTMLSGL